MSQRSKAGSQCDPDHDDLDLLEGNDAPTVLTEILSGSIELEEDERGTVNSEQDIFDAVVADSLG